MPKREKQEKSYSYLSKACIETAKEFTANVERSDRLSVLPGYAFLKGEYWHECMAEARNQVEIQDESDGAFFERANLIYSKLYQTKSVEEASKDLHRAKSNVEIALSRIPIFQETLSALLEAMIIHAWTTYESMAEDLHERARIEQPSRFSTEALTQRYYFRTEQGLIEAYDSGFKSATISAAVWNPEVKALAMLRHAIIHRRGVVDDHFVKQCAGQNKHGTPIGTPVVTDFLEYKATAKIPISGELSRSLIDRLVEAGYKLISAVDRWLQ